MTLEVVCTLDLLDVSWQQIPDNAVAHAYGLGVQTRNIFREKSFKDVAIRSQPRGRFAAWCIGVPGANCPIVSLSHCPIVSAFSEPPYRLFVGCHFNALSQYPAGKLCQENHGLGS